jgi:hypothetical protein
VGFFATYRQLYPVSRDVLRGAAEQFQGWVKEQAGKWNAPIVEAPKGRRDEFVEPYFSGAKSDQVVVILKAREPARIMTAIGDKKVNRWHLQIADRWVVQYNFYVNDRRWGRMFVRMCPYLPFSAWVCLSQHHWWPTACVRTTSISNRPVGASARKPAGPVHVPTPIVCTRWRINVRSLLLSGLENRELFGREVLFNGVSHERPEPVGLDRVKLD